MEYRKAIKSDYPEILIMYKAAINAMQNGGIHQWDDIYPAEDILTKDIENDEMYIGIINSDIAAAYTLNRQQDEQYNNGSWHYKGQNFLVLHRMCVNPAFQKMGIATQTGKHIEETLRREGFESIRLDTYSENPAALKLYDRLGYRKVGNVHFRKGLFYLFEKEL